jgi:hypothetical protein
MGPPSAEQVTANLSIFTLDVVRGQEGIGIWATALYSLPWYIFEEHIHTIRLSERCPCMSEESTASGQCGNSLQRCLPVCLKN